MKKHEIRVGRTIHGSAGVVQIIVEQNKYTYYIVFWILVLIRLSVSIYCVTDR